MKTIKVIIISIPVSLGLFGCMFAYTWGKVANATAFTWKQVPEVRFYVNITIILGLVLFILYKSKSDLRKKEDRNAAIKYFFVPVLIVVVMISRALWPATLTITPDGISTRAGFAGALDTNKKIVSMVIPWKDISSYECYASNNTEVTHWSSGGDTSETVIQEGIKLFAGYQTMDIPLQVEDQSPIYLVTSWVFGDEDFNVPAAQRAELQQAIVAHLPPTATVGCR